MRRAIEIINALRSADSQGEQTFLGAAADLIESQQRRIDVLIQTNEILSHRCEIAYANERLWKRPWIPVTERLPNPKDEYGWVDCIVTVLESKWPRSSYDIVDVPESNELILPAKFDCFQKIWHVAECAVNALMAIDDSPLNGWYVTHWMPMPDGPEEE